MLTLTTDDNKSTCFKFIGSEAPQKTTHLISNNTSLISNNVGGGTDTCSFYSGPSDATIVAFGESCETSGSIAYSGMSESCGSIAYSGASESCGSIASSFSGGGFSSSVSVGGSCSYSC